MNMGSESESTDVSTGDTSLVNEVFLPDVEKNTSDNTLRTFSDYLKDIRIEFGYSQRDFANIIGITQANLCNLEKGRYKTKPIKRVILALAPYFRDSKHHFELEELAALAGYEKNKFKVDSQSVTLSKEEKIKRIDNLSLNKIDFLLGVSELLDGQQNEELLEKIVRMLKDINSEGNEEQASKEQKIIYRDFILCGLKVLGY